MPILAHYSDNVHFGGAAIANLTVYSGGNQANSPYYRTYLQPEGTCQLPCAISRDGAAFGEFWMQFGGCSRPYATAGVYSSTYFDAGKTWIEVRSGSTALFRIATNASQFDLIELQAWDGAAWVVLDTAPGSDFVTAGQLREMMYVKIDDVAGAIEYSRDGIVLLSFAGDTLRAGLATADLVVISGTKSGRGPTLFNIYFADEDLTDVRCQHSYAHANGDLTQWGADNSLVDYRKENDGPGADSSFLLSDAVGEKGLLNCVGPSPDFSTGFAVMGVMVHARLRATTNAVGSARTIVRSGTSDGAGETISLTDTFGVYQQFHGLNPATGAAWAHADLETVQFGVESVSV